MINACAQAGETEKAEQWLKKAKLDGKGIASEQLAAMFQPFIAHALSLEFNVRQKMHLEPDAMSYNGVLNACAMTGQISSPLVQLETTVF